MRLHPVGAERREGPPPLLWHPLGVGAVLLVLGRLADPALELGITDGHKRPRLSVCTRWRRVLEAALRS